MPPGGANQSHRPEDHGCGCFAACCTAWLPVRPASGGERPLCADECLGRVNWRCAFESIVFPEVFGTCGGTPGKGDIRFNCPGTHTRGRLRPRAPARAHCHLPTSPVPPAANAAVTAAVVPTASQLQSPPSPLQLPVPQLLRLMPRLQRVPPPPPPQPTDEAHPVRPVLNGGPPARRGRVSRRTRRPAAAHARGRPALPPRLCRRRQCPRPLGRRAG